MAQWQWVKEWNTIVQALDWLKTSQRDSLSGKLSLLYLMLPANNDDHIIMQTRCLVRLDFDRGLISCQVFERRTRVPRSDVARQKNLSGGNLYLWSDQAQWGSMVALREEITVPAVLTDSSAKDDPRAFLKATDGGERATQVPHRDHLRRA